MSEEPSLKVGDTLYGFCGGSFGRDSYGEKTIVAFGPDWVVAREDGVAVFSHRGPDDLVEYLQPEPVEW